LALLIFVWTNTSFAADKIGFIHIQEIIQNSNAGKKAAEEFKKLLGKSRKASRAMENDVKNMKDELDKQSSVMTAGARSDKETAYQKKNCAITRFWSMTPTKNSRNAIRNILRN